MLDAADRSPGRTHPWSSRSGLLATPRRRALVACAVLALVVHGVLIGEIPGLAIATTAESGAAPVLVRTIASAAQEATPQAETAVAEAPVAAPISVPKPIPVRRPREAAAPTSEPAVASAASEPASAVEAAAQAMPTVPPPLTAIEAASAAAAAAAAESTATGSPPMRSGAELGGPVASSPGPSAEGSSLLGKGEQPPPVYRTRLPPSATLRYQVRRGFLRGTGEIRWQASGEGYRLVLEARIAGLTLLLQTSEGAIDANGLAPIRFLDQRARRPAQAANFRRDIDRITFSGPAVEWPLLAGTQDRLSWMIQLAAIAAAEPDLLVEGGRISMVVVGARGEAGVWTLRCAGREDVETAWGTVHAVKLVREGHSIRDTGAEIWLDPERDYLPAHATLRNSAGASEYELLLERVEPPS